MDRLREVLQRDDGGLSLRTDPTALAPECLLVFEAKGPVVNMARAVNGIAGLELVDEEEWAGEKGETSVAYLMVPDQRALGNILSLWDRWQSGRDLGSGNAPWRDLFKLLKDLRRWGPNDRLDTSDHSGLQVIADRLSDDEDMAGIEIELVYSNTERASAFSQYVSTYIYKCGGSILSRKRIEEINYDGILALVTGRELKLILKHSQDTLATAEEIRHIRPQSQAASVTKEDAKVEIVDAGAAQIGLPILAMIDGATVAGHPLLADRTRVEDVFDLDTAAATPVENRQHGTAMASLIVHGDLNDPNRLPLPRQICTVPAMRWNGYEEELPANRLIIDLVYQAVLHLRGLTDADILIINLSLGNTRRPFHGRMSPWARLLDWLACEYGILFIVSAGNKEESFPVSAYTTRTALEDANPGERAKNLLAAVDAVK
ncbi:MAG: hypothetical protein RLY86_3700, partial [Pseudomonadota bacterium]